MKFKRVAMKNKWKLGYLSLILILPLLATDVIGWSLNNLKASSTAFSKSKLFGSLDNSPWTELISHSRTIVSLRLLSIS